MPQTFPIPKRKRGGPQGTKAERMAQRLEFWEELIKLRLRGISQRKCAELMGIDHTTVKVWMRNPEFKLRYMKARADVFIKVSDDDDQKARRQVVDIEKLIEKYSETAIRNIYHKMQNAKKEEVQLRAAMDLADRGKRTSKTKKVESTSLHALITPEALAQASLVAREIRLIGKRVEPVELDPADLVGDITDLDP